MYHILWKDQERPSSDASCFRMTDEWWNMCLLCWSRDPSQRTSIASIVEIINTLQVCNRCEFSSLGYSSNVTCPQTCSKAVTASLVDEVCVIIFPI